MAAYQAEQEPKEQERKAEFERQQQEYEAELGRRVEQRKARLASFERIFANAPATFNPRQWRVFLSALVNLDPYDFAEEVAQHYTGVDENDPRTAEDVLSSTLATLPEDQLTRFALRLGLTGHPDLPRENDLERHDGEKRGYRETTSSNSMKAFSGIRASVIALLLVASVCLAQDRAPATPLITHNAYFSVWSNTDKLTDSVTRH